MNSAQFLAAVELLHQQTEFVQNTRDAKATAGRLLDGTASVAEWADAGENLLRRDAALASALLEVAVQQQPGASQLHYLFGNALRMSARPESAEAALRVAIALDPGHAESSLSLAHLLREQGRMSALGEVMTALWQHEPRTVDSDRRTLAFLRECQRYAEADRLATSIIAAHPEDGHLLRMAGETALVLGRFDEAREFFRRALAADPEQASAWLRLAHTHRFVDVDDPDLVLLKAASTRDDLADEISVSIGFGLGKALDDLGQTAESARVLSRANASWRAAHGWDAPAWARFVEAQMHAPILPAVATSAESTPVFIVGLPRSGTTLTESLLARDAQVRSRGELNWISALARQLGAQPSAAMLAAAGVFHQTQLRQDDAPARFHIDKNPLNFRHLGLIAAMLPQAKIIHCRRDLRDTALSVWSQHFAHDDMSWSYDLDDIGAYANGYLALMRHWKQTLPLPIFDLDYETLVGAPEATMTRARQFLGLDENATTVSPVEPAVMATASVWQARQRVHSKSINRWQRYSEFLPGLAKFASL